MSDVMRPGVLTCATTTSLRAVARLMAANRVHSVLVTETEVDAPGLIGRRAWGIVSDLALIGVADSLDHKIARDVVQIDLPTVHPETTLREAAHLMTRHRVTHLIVDDRDTRQPLGVVSTLDLIGALGAADE